MANPNLIPGFALWSPVSGDTSNDMSSLSIAADGLSCSFSVSHESTYLLCTLDNLTSILGHNVKLTIGSFTCSDNEGRFRLRVYDALKSTYVQQDFYTQSTVFPFEYTFDVPSDCGRLRFYIAHDYASLGISPPALITVSGITLVDTYIESLNTLNFHKVLEENLPAQVTPGTEHVYFTTDGSTVKQYISTREGYLVPVGAVGTAGGESAAYSNAYTQQHIDERKQEIIDLYRAGKCFAFAVATDIHVRIEDGDAGRYNRVRDYMMLCEQLPLDYILCEGDIMSYTQEWDGVFEPRIEKVKNIFSQARSPWLATRGNHDYNSDDYGYEGNANIVDMNLTTVGHLFITNKIWHQSISSQLKCSPVYEVVFNPGYEQYGYFYVDDAAHKHRFIVCNTSETHETPDGKPYVDGSTIDAFVNGVKTKHQVEWLAYKALDMSGKSDWVVSFHSHYIPYTDAAETNLSEFHGYGGDDPSVRALVTAFQNGATFSGSFNILEPENHSWYNILIQKDYSVQGAIPVIGWFGGHIHDDCYRKVNGLNLCVSTCTCDSQRTSWTLDPTPAKLPPERNSSDLAMSVNVFIVNTSTKTVNVIKVGSKRDNSVKTSSDYSFTYS